jgi:hypothetical protein
LRFYVQRLITSRRIILNFLKEINTLKGEFLIHDLIVWLQNVVNSEDRIELEILGEGLVPPFR